MATPKRLAVRCRVCISDTIDNPFAASCGELASNKCIVKFKAKDKHHCSPKKFRYPSVWRTVPRRLAEIFKVNNSIHSAHFSRPE